MIRTAHVAITGNVQGVGYRAFVESQARARGLCGWVRNRRDGSVEAVFCGEAASVDSMIAACRSGPRMAVVEDVAVTDMPGGDEFRDFQVLATE
jgi:acylphosphatase